MMEFFKYLTSDFWVFCGITIFCFAVIMAIGWALNAFLLGLRGVKVDKVEL